jgi:hypothetical protein
MLAPIAMKCKTYTAASAQTRALAMSHAGFFLKKTQRRHNMAPLRQDAPLLLLALLASVAWAMLPLEGPAHQWVVHVPGGLEKADLAARASGLINHGQVRDRSCPVSCCFASSLCTYRI